MDQVANHLHNGNSELSPATLEQTMAVNNRLLFSQITWSEIVTCAPWITRWHSTTPTGCNSSNEPPWLTHHLDPHAQLVLGTAEEMVQYKTSTAPQCWETSMAIPQGDPI